ncbi:hypothetical protein ACHAXT_002260 [Thalassiosira profunda]
MPPTSSDAQSGAAGETSSAGAPYFAQDLEGQPVEGYVGNESGNGANDQSAFGGSSGEWTAETSAPTSAPQPPQQQSTAASNSPNEPISSVDARVLESILQDGKLDLSTEAEVQRLLDGPRLQEGEPYPSSASDGNNKYQSKFVSAVSDNAFWNSLKAKTREIIDSVGIYVENRIERDTAALAAVGLFTLDRIRKDIGRALPAAGRATRKLLLATNSSYAERLLDATENTPFALPSERSLTNGEMLDGYDDLYEELTTPADEIRQVTAAIRDILAGKEPESYSNTRRGVRSFAPAGTSRMAERQKRAYRARKATVLKREREGIDQKVGRAVGAVSDTAWELKREMQTGTGREAGYRSKGVRNALASGAVRLLEAGREGSRRLLGGAEEEQRRMIEGGAGPGVVGDGMPEIVDVSPLEEEEIIEEVIEEENMEYAPDGLLSPRGFVEEKRRLVASLESCLSQPSETWLTKEIVAEAAEYGISLDGTVLREVITSMVTLRDGLQKDLAAIEEGFADLKMEYVSAELRRMKQSVDSLAMVAASAVGASAAQLLKYELEGFVLSDTLDDIIETELERMEQMLAERVAAREEEVRERRRRQRDKQRQQQQYQQEQRQRQQQQYMDASAAVVTEVVDSTVVDQIPTAGNARWNGGMYTEVEVVSSSPENASGQQPYESWTGQEGEVPYSGNVEVVSDSEYSEYEQRFQSAQRAAAGDDFEVETASAEENPATEFVLRVVDVLFFVGEKVFLVLLPDLITGGARISERYARANNRGRGTVGWKPLRNAKTKNIR